MGAGPSAEEPVCKAFSKRQKNEWEKGAVRGRNLVGSREMHWGEQARKVNVKTGEKLPKRRERQPPYRRGLSSDMKI